MINFVFYQDINAEKNLTLNSLDYCHWCVLAIFLDFTTTNFSLKGNYFANVAVEKIFSMLSYGLVCVMFKFNSSAISKSICRECLNIGKVL